MDELKNVEADSVIPHQDWLFRSTSTETWRKRDDPFCLLFENSLDAIVIADEDGKFLDMNASAIALFGYSREQMLLMRIGDLVTPEAPNADERYERYVQTGRETGEFRFIRPDNAIRIASYSACRIAPGRHLSILRDLTERRREQEAAAEELARQARLYDTTLSSITDFAYVFDREGRFVYANHSLLTFLQRELKDVQGKNFAELDYPPALAARLQEQVQSVCQTGQLLKDETPFTDSAGATGYYEYIFVPVFGTDGQVEAVAGSTRDITAKQREILEKEALVKALEVERARLSDLFMQAPAFIAVTRDPDHVFERVNPPYQQLVGHRDLCGRTVREAFPEIEGQGYFEILDEVYRTGKPFIGKDMRILFQDEPDAPMRERFLDFVYQPLIEADGSVSGIFVHGVDLTERKKAEEALLQHQADVETLNKRLRRAMTETHHRVKNNLQLISALIELQKQSGQERVPMSEIIRIGQNIQALGVIHDILTNEAKVDGDATQISVKAMLEQFLPLLQTTLGERRLLLDIDEVALPGKQTTALALITNELVSNAVKHGKGEVELNLRADGDRVTFEVCDDGPGFAAGFNPEIASHTGLELIENIVRYDLQGDTAYENRPQGGARIALTFPIQHVSSR